MRSGVLLAATLAALTGVCATYAERIPPTYVFPVIYDRLTCGQIGEQATQATRRAAVDSGEQTSIKKNCGIHFAKVEPFSVPGGVRQRRTTSPMCHATTA